MKDSGKSTKQMENPGMKMNKLRTVVPGKVSSSLT